MTFVGCLVAPIRVTTHANSTCTDIPRSSNIYDECNFMGLMAALSRLLAQVIESCPVPLQSTG